MDVISLHIFSADILMHVQNVFCYSRHLCLSIIMSRHGDVCPMLRPYTRYRLMLRPTCI